MVPVILTTTASNFIRQDDYFPTTSDLLGQHYLWPTAGISTSFSIDNRRINCSDQQLLYRPLVAGQIDYFIQHWIFPFQFAFGFFGNIFNLLVLFRERFKNHTNSLLCAMSLADTCFLLCMLPASLGSFQFFYTNVRFIYYYYSTKTYFNALANMFSTTAILLVFSITMERFLGVRYPMRAFTQRVKIGLKKLLLYIVITAFLLTFFHYIEYRVHVDIKCNSVKSNFQRITTLNDTSIFMKGLVHYGKLTHIIVGVTIPVLAVFVLNLLLLNNLKRQIQQKNTLNNYDIRVHSNISQRQERKVTVTVIVIITSFSITHLPSLFPFILELQSHIPFISLINPSEYLSVTTLNDIITLLNTFVVFGKVFNFVLFCISSQQFRKQAFIFLCDLWCEKNRKQYSSTITTLAQGGIGNLTDRNVGVGTIISSEVSSTEFAKSNGCYNGGGKHKNKYFGDNFNYSSENNYSYKSKACQKRSTASLRPLRVSSPTNEILFNTSSDN